MLLSKPGKTLLPGLLARELLWGCTMKASCVRLCSAAGITLTTYLETSQQGLTSLQAHKALQASCSPADTTPEYIIPFTVLTDSPKIPQVTNQWNPKAFASWQ